MYVSFSLLIFGYVYKQSSSLSWKWAKAGNIGWVLTISKPMKIQQKPHKLFYDGYQQALIKGNTSNDINFLRQTCFFQFLCFCCFCCRQVDRSVGWQIGGQAGRQVGRSVGGQVARQGGRLAGRQVGIHACMHVHFYLCMGVCICVMHAVYITYVLQ